MLLLERLPRQVRHPGPERTQSNAIAHSATIRPPAMPPRAAEGPPDGCASLAGSSWVPVAAAAPAAAPPSAAIAPPPAGKVAWSSVPSCCTAGLKQPACPTTAAQSKNDPQLAGSVHGKTARHHHTNGLRPGLLKAFKTVRTGVELLWAIPGLPPLEEHQAVRAAGDRLQPAGLSSY